MPTKSVLNIVLWTLEEGQLMQKVGSDQCYCFLAIAAPKSRPILTNNTKPTHFIKQNEMVLLNKTKWFY